MNINLSTTRPLNLKLIGKHWALCFLFLEILVFTILYNDFLSLRTTQEILLASTTILLLAVGQSYVIITGGIDLSIGFVMGFSSIISAKSIVGLYEAGYSQPVAIMLGISFTLVIGLIPGLTNGFLVTKLKVPPFIATFSMYGIAYGVAEIISDGSAITNLPDLTGEIGNGYFMFWIPDKLITFFIRPENVPRRELRDMIEIIPNLVVFLILFIIIVAFVLKSTRFGRYTYAIGGNKEAAKRAGIKVDWHLMKVYMLSSFCASLSGIMYIMKFVTGKADAGSGRMLDAVVAVVIGGASLYGGVGSIKGTVIGCLIIAVLETGLRVLGIPSFNIYISVGIILILAVLIDQFTPETTQ